MRNSVPEPLSPISRRRGASCSRRNRLNCSWAVSDPAGSESASGIPAWLVVANWWTRVRWSDAVSPSWRKPGVGRLPAHGTTARFLSDVSPIDVDGSLGWPLTDRQGIRYRRRPDEHRAILEVPE